MQPIAPLSVVITPDLAESPNACFGSIAASNDRCRRIAATVLVGRLRWLPVSAA
jgi:hypothetical protein